MMAGCSHGQKKGQNLLTIQTSQIKLADFAPSINAISMLESSTNVSLTPETSGSVVKILAKEGQSVKAGQAILVLDNVQQSAALDSSKADALKDKLNAERFEYLFQRGATSAKTRDQYVTKAIQSRDKARADRATLNYKFVRSPINGIIGNLDSVKLGDYIKEGQSITGIVDNSSMWTLMEIPATQASKIKLGQPVEVISQSTPPIKKKGSVVFISPYYAINDEKQSPNTLLIKAVFSNLTGELKTGQFVQSRIITSQKKILAVPVQAVLMQAEQPFVYKVLPLKTILPKIKASTTIPKKNKTSLERLPSNTPVVVQTQVKLGPLQNNYYPVTSGLKQGETVAISNTSRLRSGMPVHVHSPNVSNTTKQGGRQ
ncbi:efflux RND transporter periplasmic adaptor subunit [Prochlorococcus sp. MIT 1306]|uniref:efflux RND transporter periplasmic adaptor subunit n=1 Tax=Prochlorococcus sp. MIT 1306 TaxID=1799667 RepID=UPI0009EDEB12|nr:efflux RND transporter periplasmic adaptor subunit [Prochlorococcus sp. MIT 1306]